MMSEMDSPGWRHPDRSGMRVGPYRLLREIGTGGMGTVYLAARDDGQFAKSVALKISHFATGDDVRARFYKERQILACLNHPNIAALLDGGETEDGHLYEVMEYVDGQPIHAYCDEHQLDVDARLRLFLHACAAVQHAHRHLIVHRDLKPANILVTPDGVLKLIDFGIAKVLRPDLFPLLAMETQPGEAMMTPLYASPEQIQGQPVSTSTDVYALGVVLFELLAGESPYAGPQSGLALREAVCEKPPRKLSEAGADRAWRKSLLGDLDTILAMALRKEPERRYGSVEQLAADLKRHLDGFPVSARKDAGAYRVRKFLGRHRSLVAAAAAAVVVLAGSSVVNYRLARQAQYERDTARAVADFMGRIFSASNPAASSSKDLTAREVLERGEARIGEELKSKPEVQARLLTIIGLTQKDLGNVDRAQPLLERALATRLALHGEMNADVAETLHGLARVLMIRGRLEESEKALRRGLHIQQAVLPRRSRETLWTMNTLGLVLHQRGQLGESAVLLEAALGELARAGEAEAGSADDLYEDALVNYSLVLQELGRLDECERARRTLMELDRKRHGEDHIHYAMDLAVVGTMLSEREALEEAEPMLRRAYETYRKAVAPGSTGVIHTMHYLAMCLQRMGRLAEAEALWNELRPLRLKLTGEKNRFVASDWGGWADLLRRKGDLAGAEVAARKAIEIRAGVLKPGHPAHAWSRAELGRILAAKGDLAGAEAELRVAYDLLRARHGDSNPRTTAAMKLELGRVLARAGRGAEADALLRQSYEARRNALPADDWQLAESMFEYGQFLVASGREKEGEPLVAQANVVRARRPRPVNKLAKL